MKLGFCDKRKKFSVKKEQYLFVIRDDIWLYDKRLTFVCVTRGIYLCCVRE